MSNFNDYCDKCNRKAKHYIISSDDDEDMSLCEKHFQEYNALIKKTKHQFLSEKETDNVIENEATDCSSLSMGDKVYCAHCKKVIELNKETLKFDYVGEYIVCPYCKTGVDIQYYHLYGKKYKA